MGSYTQSRQVHDGVVSLLLLYIEGIMPRVLSVAYLINLLHFVVSSAINSKQNSFALFYDLEEKRFTSCRDAMLHHQACMH